VVNVTSLLIVALLVFGITALAIDAIYTTLAWLIGREPHPYQRPHRFRRYVWIVSLIAAEVAVITVLVVLLIRTIQPPGLELP
jgi:hypothetical protein